MRALLFAGAVLWSCGTTPAGAPAPVAAARQAQCGQASDETVRIMQGLAGPCQGCHLSGTRAFFTSVGAFQDLVVANPALIVPGDPDSSQFVKLLLGQGSGSFPQMPVGSKTYGQLLRDGTASLSIDEIRAWISGLGSQARGSGPNPQVARVARVKPLQIQRALYQQLGLVHADFFSEAQEYGVVMAESRGDDAYPFQPSEALPAPRQGEPAGRAQGLGAGNPYAQVRSDLSLAPSFVLTLTQVSQRWCRMALAKTGNQALFPAGSSTATDEANVKATIGRWFTHFHGVRASQGQLDDLYATVWVPLALESTEGAWVGLCSSFIRHPSWIFY